MLVWLDSNTNTKAHPNENFSRELMELFTMGVNNGYSQGDVVEAARAFTGWFLDRNARAFSFNAAQHDSADKTFLGQTGPWDGTDVVHMVVNSPASPVFLCTKLWRFFAGPDDPAAIGDMVSAWTSSGLNIGEAVRVMLTHPSFYTDAVKTGLIKQPAEYLAGAMHATHSPASVLKPYWYLGDLGQDLFRPPNVGGWGANRYWVSTASESARANFSQGAAQAALSGGSNAFLQEVMEIPARDAVLRVFHRFGLASVAPQTQAACEAFLASDRQAAGWRPGQAQDLLLLVLMSPDFLMN
jgi:uncharacterized protein (DUF1800 family)